MIVTWHVTDTKKQLFTEVPDDEYDECKTEHEKIILVDDYVREDFQERIGFVVTHIGKDKI